MDDRNNRRFERATRVQTFGRDHAADFASGSKAAALDACNSGKHSDNLEGIESTSAIDTLLGQAQAIITRLDAAILNKYRTDPDKLDAWKSASRTEHPAKKAAPVTTVDSIISIALSSQVSAWKVRDTFEQRAARGKVEDLSEILARAPDSPPAPGDEVD